MLSSALIGCFTERLISKKETQVGKYIFQYFLSQLYRQVINYTVYKTQASGSHYIAVIVSLSRDAMHKL